MLSRSWCVYQGAYSYTADILQVIAVGLGHVRASKDRRSIPAFVVINAVWSALALSTVALNPRRATSALLMTGINHFIFATIMFVRSRTTLRELLGGEYVETKEL